MRRTCLLVLFFALLPLRPAAGQLVTAAGDERALWIVQAGSEKETLAIFQRATTDPPGAIRLATVVPGTLTQSASQSGAAAADGTLYLAFANHNVTSFRVEVRDGEVLTDETPLPNLPQGVALRCLAADARGPWALVQVTTDAELQRIDEPTAPAPGAASDAGDAASRPQPATRPSESRSPASPPERLLRLAGQRWVSVPLPADWVDGRPVWLVMLDTGAPVLITEAAAAPAAPAPAPGSATSPHAAPGDLFVYRYTPPQPATAPASPALTAPADESSAGSWSPLAGSNPIAIKHTAGLFACAIDGTIVLAQQSQDPAKKGPAFTLNWLRPEGAGSVGALALDLSPGVTSAITAAGDAVALLAAVPKPSTPLAAANQGSFVWSRIDLTGHVLDDGAALSEKSPLGGTIIDLFSATMLAVGLIMVVIFWRREPAASRLSLPRDMVPADLGRRVAAGFIDAVPPAALVLFFFHLPLGNPEPLYRSVGLETFIAFIAFRALWVGHVMITEWITGRSLGKVLMGLRVTTTAGERPRFTQVLVRNLLKFVDLAPAAPWCLFLLMLPALHPSRQRLGDLVSRTVVVAPRGEEEEAEEEEE